MPLTDQERKVLEIPYRQGWSLCKEPVHKALKSLAERGYCRFSRALSGPLGLPTGEMMVDLTEACRDLFDREVR
jgi:hypothetical protein